MMRRRVIAGLSWTAAAQIINTSVAFIVSVVLARLLSPFEFGVVAMAMGVQGVIAGLADFGFAALIVSTRFMTPAELNGILLLRLVLALSQMVLVYVCAPLFAQFFGHTELVSVIRVLSGVFVISALSMVPEALLQKQLEFRKLTIASIISAALSGAIGIALAILDFGVWSLVAQYLMSATMVAVILFFSSRWHPTMEVSYSAVIGNLRYLLNTYGLNVVGALVQQSDRLVVGSLLGASSLGLYVRGLGLAQQVQGPIMSIAGQVGFPALSALVQEPRRAKQAFLQMVGVVADVVIPIMLLIVALANPILAALFGNKWIASGPVLAYIAIGLMLNSLNITWDWLLRAQGRVDVLFRWSLFDGSLRIIALSIGAYLHGIDGAAMGFATISLPLLFVRAYYFGRNSDILVKDFFRPTGRPLLLGAASGIAAFAASAAFQPEHVRLAAGVTSGAITYLIASYYFGNPLLARFVLFVRS